MDSLALCQINPGVSVDLEIQKKQITSRIINYKPNWNFRKCRHEPKKENRVEIRWIYHLISLNEREEKNLQACNQKKNQEFIDLISLSLVESLVLLP